MSLKLFLFWHDRLLAESLAESLHRQPGMVMIGCTDRVSRAVIHLRRYPADVVLVEARGPATAAVVARLTEQVPGCRVLVYGLRTARAVVRQVEAGASGYVRRTADFGHLVRAIHALVRGRPLCDLDVEWLLEERVRRLRQEVTDDAAEAEELTPRETEVLTYLDRGLTNKELAQNLDIRPATAKNHVHAVVRKLGVANRREAVRRAHVLGWL